MTQPRHPQSGGGRDVLVGLGANLAGRAGSPSAVIRRSLRELAPVLGVRGPGGVRASSLWRTPAWPAGSGPDYVNAALAVAGVTLAPDAVLARLHAMEAAMGRARPEPTAERPAERWAPRTLDLDLLAVGDAVAPDAATQTAWREADPEVPPEGAGPPGALILPHPRMGRRAFVLVPLSEVAPDWRHPLTGLSAARMLVALPRADRDAVRRID